MGAMASQITSLTIVCSSVYSGTDQRKHQSSTSLAFVRGIHRWPVNSPHKGPVTRKFFPFDDVILGSAAIITFTNRPGVNLSAGLLDWLYVLSLYRRFIPLVLKQSAFNWTNGQQVQYYSAGHEVQHIPNNWRNCFSNLNTNNSLAPVRCKQFKSTIFEPVKYNVIGLSCEITHSEYQRTSLRISQQWFRQWCGT